MEEMQVWGLKFIYLLETVVWDPLQVGLTHPEDIRV
jgi:hypothetical protein